MGVKVRELEPGKWYVVVHFGGRRITKLCASKEEAEGIARELGVLLKVEGKGALKRLADKSGSRRRVPTFADFAGKWLQEIERSGIKESTFRSYVSVERRHLRPELGGLPLDEITYSTVKRLLVHRRDVVKLSRGSLRRMMRVLRNILQEAVREGLIPENPVRDLGHLYRNESSRIDEGPDPFSREEIDLIEEVAGGRFVHYHSLIALLARTGMRFGEAAGLEERDLDFSARVIKVRRSRPAGNRGRISSLKTPSSRREVDMSRDLSETLRGLLKRRREEEMRKGVPSTDPSQLLFPGERGEHLAHPTFWKVWSRILKLAKVRYRSPHNLRHSFASELLSQGESLLYVSRQLGHSNPSITLSVYARWIPRDSTSRGVDKLDRRGIGDGEEKVKNVSKTSVEGGTE